MSDFLAQSAFFGVGVSILGYMLGLYIKKKTGSALANPLLIAILFVMAAITLLGVEYEPYRAGAQPLSYLLTPATVCLAVPLYKQRKRLVQNWAAVAAGIVTGAFVNLFCVFISAALFGFTHRQYVTLLPKSVTSAIGFGISEELGGFPSLTVAAIIITGILGNIAAEHILNLVRVRDPVARGVAIGAGAHAIGTARALELGETEGAMSGLAIALTGILTVALAPLFASLL